MLQSDVLNVAMGLITVFAAMGLIVSAMTEAVSSVFKWRSRNLISGLQTILNDKPLEGLAGAVLNHAAVCPRASGTNVADSIKYGIRPTYIAPLQFASALFDIVKDPNVANVPPGTFAIDDSKIPDGQMKTLIEGIHSRVGGSVEAFRKEVADWFDSAMDRVSGGYKRQSQLFSFILAAVLVCVLNADAIQISRSIWRHHKAVTDLQINDKTPADAALQQLLNADIPFGWNQPADDSPTGKAYQAPEDGWGSITAWTYKVLGWLFMAMAAMVGAPFWFDMLSKFVQLRGAGPAPKTQPAK